MAKNAKTVSIKSWQDVTDAVAEMSNLCADRTEITSKYEPELRRLQGEQNELLAPIDARYAELESKVKEFALNHLDGFGKKKSLDFPYGTVSMRKTESMKYDKSEQATSEKLRDMGLKDCFKETLKPVVSALKRLSQDVLDLVGASVVESVSITVKPLGKD